MKILICGFYGHKNLGDDIFQVVLNEILSQHQLTYQELSTLDKVDLTPYDVVLVGGGDLFNDFYGIKYEEVLKNYNGYKIAVSVGFSFEECTKRKYISYFDDIILRSRRDIPRITRILGSLHTHYMPDLAFSLPLPEKKERGERQNVGFFLVGSLSENYPFLFSLCNFTNFLITNGFKIHLIPMYTESDHLNDTKINEIVFKTFLHSKSIYNYGEMTYDKYLELVSDMDYALCIRFHSHIFCTRFGIPFLSIPITRKCEIYMSEIPESNQASVFFDQSYNIISFDVEDMKSKFMSLRNNYSSISQALLSHSKDISLPCDKLCKILEDRKKRVIAPQDLLLMNPEEVYDKYLKIFLDNGVNIFLDRPASLLSQKFINDIADNICYELTNDPANDYIYGTRINLTENLAKLRDMIYYIYQHNLDKMSYPKVNINYIKQDSFKGLHRAGWQYAIDSLYCLSGDHGVFLDTYLDRTFGWASNVLGKVLPYTNHWVGFFHHTFEKEFSDNNCEKIFQNKLFHESLPMCKGIFCLTHYLSNLIRDKLKEIGYENIPVETLNHPTIFTDKLFSISRFIDNGRKIVNIGSWYRNPITIHALSLLYQGREIESFSFYSLKGKKMESNFCPLTFTVKILEEGGISCNDNIWTKYFIKYINEKSSPFSLSFYDDIISRMDEKGEVVVEKEEISSFLSGVEIISELSNDDYDNFMSQIVVFLDLVDASTVNTILECIVRNTPIIVNKIEPTLELLGQDYPLFYDNVEDIISLLTNEKIEEAHNFIKNMDKEKYRIESFKNDFLSSNIYKSL